MNMSSLLAQASSWSPSYSRSKTWTRSESVNSAYNISCCKKL